MMACSRAMNCCKSLYEKWKHLLNLAGTAIKIDAALFDPAEQKSYLYHKDRYFVFQKQDGVDKLTLEGSLKLGMPWLPTPLDAVYMSFKNATSYLVVRITYYAPCKLCLPEKHAEFWLLFTSLS